jgi:hypothetical protein
MANKSFYRRVKLNWEIALTKEKINQKNEGKIKKTRQQKLWLNDEIESKKNFNKRSRKKIINQ